MYFPLHREIGIKILYYIISLFYIVASSCFIGLLEQIIWESNEIVNIFYTLCNPSRQTWTSLTLRQADGQADS